MKHEMKKEKKLKNHLPTLPPPSLSALSSRTTLSA